MDIEKLAREAGVVDYGVTIGGGANPALTRFAALVVEECAKVCEAKGPEFSRWWGDGQGNAAAQDCAAAIRAQVPPQSEVSAR